MNKKQLAQRQQEVLDGHVLKPCPFCGGSVGILEIEGGWRWWGIHKDFCPLEGNHSAWYGRREHLIEEWNKRYIPQVSKIAKRWRKRREQEQEHGQEKVRGEVVAAGRKRGQVRKAPTHIS